MENEKNNTESLLEFQFNKIFTYQLAEIEKLHKGCIKLYSASLIDEGIEDIPKFLEKKFPGVAIDGEALSIFVKALGSRGKLSVFNILFFDSLSFFTRATEIFEDKILDNKIRISQLEEILANFFRMLLISGKHAISVNDSLIEAFDGTKNVIHPKNKITPIGGKS